MKKIFIMWLILTALSGCVYSRSVTKNEEYNQTVKNTSSYIEKLSNEDIEILVENISELSEKARSYYDSGNYVMAIRCYDKIIEFYPENAPAYFLRGLIYFEKYDALTQALQDFTSAIKYSPDNPNYYLYRGVVRDKLDDCDGAISDLTKAIDIYEKNGSPDAFSYQRRALLYAKKNQDKLAIEDATKAIKVQPKYPEAFYCRGIAKVDLALQSNSISGLENAIQDIYYAKEQYLEKGDIKGYQNTIEFYNYYKERLDKLKNLKK